jgi:hypothetical protein
LGDSRTPFQMKILTILGLVQTGILLLLLGKIMLLEDEMAVAGPAIQDTSVSRELSNTQSQSTSRGTTVYADEDRLRQIIREELAAQPGGAFGSANQVDAISASNPVDPAENQRQRELVTQQLNYFSSVGSISDMDMQKLQGEIAKLDNAGRKEMLGKLVRAMNSGELEGRL